MLSRLTLLRVAAAPVAVAATMIFALAGDGNHGFWSVHPMLGALVSGTLLFAAASLVVDRLVERRNSKRWGAVSVAADRDLGDHLTEVLVRLWLLHSDPDPYRGDSELWTPASRASLQQSRGRSSPSRLTTYDPRDAAVTPVDRLLALLADDAFVKQAREEVAALRNGLRERAHSWAALMMWAADSQHLLNCLGLLAENHLSALEYFLACDPAGSVQAREQAAQQWALADVKARALINALWGDHTRYRWALPAEAAGSLSDAFRYQDTVGRWRPQPTGPMSSSDYLRRRIDPRVPRVLRRSHRLSHEDIRFMTAQPY